MVEADKKSDDAKKSNWLTLVIAPVIVALFVGGTSPWWIKEYFPGKPADNTNVKVEQPKPDPKNNIADIDRTELEGRQRQLEQELADLKREQQKGPNQRTVRGMANIAGSWQGGNGTYNFYQNGSNLTMEEIMPGYGRTAIGEGTISNNQVSMEINTALETSGTLQLTLSPDGRQLSGTYTDHTMGQQVYYTLTR